LHKSPSALVVAASLFGKAHRQERAPSHLLLWATLPICDLRLERLTPLTYQLHIACFLNTIPRCNVRLHMELRQQEAKDAHISSLLCIELMASHKVSLYAKEPAPRSFRSQLATNCRVCSTKVRLR